MSFRRTLAAVHQPWFTFWLRRSLSENPEWSGHPQLYNFWRFKSEGQWLQLSFTKSGTTIWIQNLIHEGNKPFLLEILFCKGDDGWDSQLPAVFGELRNIRTPGEYFNTAPERCSAELILLCRLRKHKLAVFKREEEKFSPLGRRIRQRILAGRRSGVIFLMSDQTGMTAL